MNFDLALDFLPWAGWMILLGLAAFVVGTILRFGEGHWLFRVADRKDQQRMVAVIAAQERRDEDAERAPDLFAHALEEIRNLPTRDHPPFFGGWRG